MPFLGWFFGKLKGITNLRGSPYFEKDFLVEELKGDIRYTIQSLCDNGKSHRRPWQTCFEPLCLATRLPASLRPDSPATTPPRFLSCPELRSLPDFFISLCSQLSRGGRLSPTFKDSSFWAGHCVVCEAQFRWTNGVPMMSVYPVSLV